jgi:hypothetical protein
MNSSRHSMFQRTLASALVFGTVWYPTGASATNEEGCFCNQSCYSPQSPGASSKNSPFGNVYYYFKSGAPATSTGIDNPSTSVVESSTSSSGILREATFQYNEYWKEIFIELIYEESADGKVPNFISLLIGKGDAPSTVRGSHAVMYLDGTQASSAQLTSYAFNGIHGEEGLLSSWKQGTSASSDVADKIATSSTSSGRQSLIGNPIPPGASFPYVLPREIIFTPLPAGFVFGPNTLARRGVRITASIEAEPFLTHIPKYAVPGSEWKAVSMGSKFTGWVVAGQATAVGYDSSGYLTALSLASVNNIPVTSVSGFGGETPDVMCPVDCNGKVGNPNIPACAPSPTPTALPTMTPTPQPTSTPIPTATPTMTITPLPLPSSTPEPRDCFSIDSASRSIDMDSRINALHKIALKAGDQLRARARKIRGVNGVRLQKFAESSKKTAEKLHVEGWTTSWSYPQGLLQCRGTTPSGCRVESLEFLRIRYLESVTRLKANVFSITSRLRSLKVRGDATLVKKLETSANKAQADCVLAAQSAPQERVVCE